eukprot:TRINITY_DN844_c1_g1_i1.p6 TRINITY_DN844_c1_g1~~TRINITY_DN844_c1_g1_i1.p6  ORF type:complete len:288 (-),score=23.08 TRINITY_DN844_c1_g1_i1:3677-4414(-)
MTSLYDACEKVRLPKINLSGKEQGNNHSNASPHSAKGDIELGVVRLKSYQSDVSPRADVVTIQNQYQNIGNPAPIGLFAFGMTTMMLMFKDAGWTQPGFKSMVFGYALFYGGLAQMITGFFELLKGSTFAATAFVSYGAFWMGWYMMALHVEDASAYETGLTLYFVQWGAFTFCMFVITVLKKCWALKFVFGMLFVTFVFLAGGVHHETVETVAGYLGFFTGLGAFYTGFAEVLLAETGTKLIGL